jgi:hypothetical protein
METIERPPAEPLEDSPPPADGPCTAELAECTCPDFCERDHANE